jgi:hypothetical protein
MSSDLAATLAILPLISTTWTVGGNLLLLNGSLAERGTKSKEVTIWVGDNKLLTTVFNLVLPIPSLFERNDNGKSRSLNSAVIPLNVGHFDHEVHAPTIRLLKRRRPEAPSRSGSFLEHQVHTLKGEEGKTLFRAIEHHREAYHANVKRERTIQVRHVKFGGWSAHGVVTPGLMDSSASTSQENLKL